MKKGLFYSAAIVVLDVIAAVSIVNSSVDPTKDEYKNAIAAAEKYESQELCYKAISEYYTACNINDSCELRLKIADLYEKGYENGEFSSVENVFNVMDSIIETYPEEKSSYEWVINYYTELNDYASCVDYVREAKNNGIESDVVNECYQKVRHMYTEDRKSYDCVECMGDVTTAKTTITINDEDISDQSDTANTKTYNEYVYYFTDGTESDTYEAIDMSLPAYVAFSENESHLMYFSKHYGNEIYTNEKSDQIYSSLLSDGVRQKYVGNENEFESHGPFGSGIIVLHNTKTDKYVFYNTSGECISGEYDYAGYFNEGRIYVEKDGKKQVLTSDAEVFADSLEGAVTGFGGSCSSKGRMFLKYSGESKYTMVNSEDGSKLDFTCDNADLFKDNMAAFESDGKWGFVDSDGKVQIEPQYEEAKSFSNGYAAVKQNGKWGFINSNNEMIVEPTFDDALYMDESGAAFVYSNTNADDADSEDNQDSADTEQGVWSIMRLLYKE